MWRSFPFLRVLMLSLSLGFVIYSIIYLRSEGVESTKLGQALLGHDLANPRSLDWNWCLLPIESLDWSDHAQPRRSWRIEKANEQWKVKVAEEPQAKAVALQAWLDKNCKQALRPLPMAQNPRRDYRLFVRFENDKALDLEFSAAAGHLLWENRSYEATNFLKSLQELSYQIVAPKQDSEIPTK